MSLFQERMIVSSDVHFLLYFRTVVGIKSLFLFDRLKNKSCEYQKPRENISNFSDHNFYFNCKMYLIWIPNYKFFKRAALILPSPSCATISIFRTLQTFGQCPRIFCKFVFMFNLAWAISLSYFKTILDYISA